MVKTTSKMSYRFRMLSGAEEYVEKFEQCYINAYRKGHSVLDITRAAGWKSAKGVYAALVKHGCIAQRGCKIDVE